MASTTVRPLREADLPAVGRIIPLAFGTFLGHPPDDARLDADAELNTAAARARWRSDPEAAFVAEHDGRVTGSIFAIHWGSVGFFGPLTVHPDSWSQGTGRGLLEPVMETFARWGITHAGLFTFAQSPKHLRLYQRFEFWPRFLTAIVQRSLDKALLSATRNEAGYEPDWSRFSALSAGDREGALAACRALTGSLYAGLDVARDVRAVQALGLGDTLLLWNRGELVGLAVCHWGPGSEADPGFCYIKFGAVRSGPDAAEAFAQLLRACEALAASAGMATLEAGVNVARHEAYRALLAHGWRSVFQGVAMHRPNAPGYCRAGVYVLDDWR